MLGLARRFRRRFGSFFGLRRPFGKRHRSLFRPRVKRHTYNHFQKNFSEARSFVSLQRYVQDNFFLHTSPVAKEGNPKLSSPLPEQFVNELYRGDESFAFQNFILATGPPFASSHTDLFFSDRMPGHTKTSRRLHRLQKRDFRSLALLHRIRISRNHGKRSHRSMH